MSKDAQFAGGIKGIIQRTGRLFSEGSVLAKYAATTLYQWGGNTAFMIATTSMVVLLPLLFEIGREAQMLETEKALVSDLKSKGYSDRQLKDMGYHDSVLHTPSVALAKK